MSKEWREARPKKPTVWVKCACGCGAEFKRQGKKKYASTCSDAARLANGKRYRDRH